MFKKTIKFIIIYLITIIFGICSLLVLLLLFLGEYHDLKFDNKIKFEYIKNAFSKKYEEFNCIANKINERKIYFRKNKNNVDIAIFYNGKVIDGKENDYKKVINFMNEYEIEYISKINEDIVFMVHSGITFYQLILLDNKSSNIKVSYDIKTKKLLKDNWYYIEAKT